MVTRYGTQCCRAKPQYLVPSSMVYYFCWRLCLWNLQPSGVRVSVQNPGALSVLTASTEASCLISTQVVRFQAIPSIVDDSIDGHDLYLACVVKGYPFGLGVVFGHCHDSGRCVRFLGVFRLVERLRELGRGRRR
jgi:hypothetical protein